jgi:hypothetical protein
MADEPIYDEDDDDVTVGDPSKVHGGSPVLDAEGQVTEDHDLRAELEAAGITDLHQIAYLVHLSQTAHISRSAKAARVHRMTVLRWRERSPVFCEQEKRCHDSGITLLEEEIRRRGFEGFIEPVFHKGMHVGNVRKFSDGLASLYIRKHIPTYRDTVNVNVGTDSLAAALAAARERTSGGSGDPK